MAKYVSKPVEIEAIQFKGYNLPEIRKFVGETLVTFDTSASTLIVHTNHGPALAEPNDWIIKISRGEFYPCPPEVFEEKYDSVEALKAEKAKLEQLFGVEDDV